MGTKAQFPRFDEKKLKDTNILIGYKCSLSHELENLSSHLQVEDDWETVENTLLKESQGKIPLKLRPEPWISETSLNLVAKRKAA